MFSNFLLSILAFSHFFSLAEAHQPAPGRGMVSIGPLANRFIDSPSPIASPTFFGGGVTGELDINSYGGLEVSVFYFNNQYCVFFQDNYLVEQADRLYIPLGYRYWFSKKASLGVSFYAAYRVGMWTEIASSPGLSPLINTSAQDITEFGFDFSIQADLWQIKSYTVTLDSRFISPSTDKVNENSRAYIFLLGLKYQAQAGRTDVKPK